jgi:subtilisin family serine protease
MSVDNMKVKGAAGRNGTWRFAPVLSMAGLACLAIGADAMAQGPDRAQTGPQAPYESLARELGERFPAARDRARDYLKSGPVNDATNEPLDFTSSEEVIKRNRGYTIQGRHILIQVRPDVRAPVLAKLLESLKLKVVSGALEIGLLVAEVQELPVDATDLEGDDDPNKARDEIRAMQAKIDALRGKTEIISTAVENIPLGWTCVPAYNPCLGRAFGGDKAYDADWIRNPAGDVAMDHDGNWGQKRAQFPAAWNLNNAIMRAMDRERRRNIPIAILDVGFSPHLDLEYRDLDDAGQRFGGHHGTHIAGIIAAKWNNNIGINGCTQFAELVVRRLGSGAAAGFQSYISELYIGASRLIIENPDLKVINISLGTNWAKNFRIDPAGDDRVREQISHHAPVARALADLAASRGMILVVSAGNDSRSTRPRVEAQWSTPLNWVAANATANSPQASNVLVVEALGRSGTLTPHSNHRGSIAAFGDEILSTIDRDEFNEIRNDLYGAMGGTSQAAPQVTALIVNMYAYNPRLTPAGIISRLMSTAAAPPAPWDVRLLREGGPSAGMPAEGKNLIVLAATDKAIHFRLFDGDGKKTLDIEKGLTEQHGPINDLKAQIDRLGPPHVLTGDEKGWLITAVASIVGELPPAREHSAKIIDAFAAMLACYDDDRPLRDLADLDGNGRVDLDDFNIFHRALHQVEKLPVVGPGDLNGDGRLQDPASENVWPRPDLNGSGSLSRAAADKRMVKGRLLSDLEVMKSVWMDTQVPADKLEARLNEPAPPQPAVGSPRRAQDPRQRPR